MVLYTLSGADMRRLKKLKIYPARNTRYSLVKSLMQSIKSTPNLTYICLNGFTLNLEDMESVHAEAPNLKTVKLTSITLDIIPDNDAVVSRDCGRLIDNGDGTDFVKTEAEHVRYVEIDLGCNWMTCNFRQPSENGLPISVKRIETQNVSISERLLKQWTSHLYYGVLKNL